MERRRKEPLNSCYGTRFPHMSTALNIRRARHHSATNQFTLNAPSDQETPCDVVKHAHTHTNTKRHRCSPNSLFLFFFSAEKSPNNRSDQITQYNSIGVLDPPETKFCSRLPAPFSVARRLTSSHTRSLPGC